MPLDFSFSDGSTTIHDKEVPWKTVEGMARVLEKHGLQHAEVDGDDCEEREIHGYFVAQTSNAVSPHQQHSQPPFSSILAASGTYPVPLVRAMALTQPFHSSTL